MVSFIVTSQLVCDHHARKDKKSPAYTTFWKELPIVLTK
ncbi:DUF4113 domain-containing protein [Candidatus Paracaedibacter symbiosus]